MACTGHTNSCPSHSGYKPPLPAQVWTDPTIGTDSEVKSVHWNELMLAIEAERVRRFVSKITGWGPPSTKTTNSIVYATDYRLLRDQLTQIATWSPGWASDTYVKVGGIILDETTETLRDRLNTLRTACLCNCNYSCTCNCNYCTCNCNYSCTCNCNYSCTCDCNDVGGGEGAT